MAVRFIRGETMSFTDNLNKITDTEQPFSISSLYVLSNLEPEQQREFEVAWPKVAEERRRRIAGSLPELVEEDVELDFSSIFYFLLKDADPQVRVSAMEGLWEDESRQLLGHLLNILEHDPSDKVREKAAISLSRFSYLAELGKLPERWVTRLRDTLLKMVMVNEDSDKLPLEISRRLVEDLGYFSNDDRITRIIQKAYTENNTEMKASALRAMGRNMDKRWLPEVGKEMSSKQPILRYEAATAAGEMGSEELLNPLLRLIEDKDTEVRLAAVWALGQVGGPEATKALRELAHNGPEAVREAARDSLSEVNYTANPLNVLSNRRPQS